ncbi:MAG: oligosaccharide flippase family protein [Acidimicrobiales bacterium]
MTTTKSVKGPALRRLLARRFPFVVWKGRRGRGEEAAFIVSNAIVNVANFGFFVVVGRLFTPSSYGAISALLSIVTVANTPLNAIQAGVVNATVLARRAMGEPSPRRIIGWFAVCGLALTLLVAGASGAIDRYFSLTSFVPVLMLALWFAPSVVSSALCGSLMGHYKFRVIAVANVVGALARIVLVLVFALSGHLFGLAGPVLATSTGVTVTSLWILVAVRREPSWRSPTILELHLTQTFWAFISLAGFATFVAIDVILARHLLGAAAAGNYAVASTAGKIALFLSVAVPIVAYPRFTAHHADGTSARHELRQALALVIGLGVLAGAVMALVPHLVIAVLFGHRYVAAPMLLRILAPEGAAMGVVGLFTYYHVAQRSLYAFVPWSGVALVTLFMTTGRLHAHGLALLMLVSAVAVALLMAIPALWGDPVRHEVMLGSAPRGDFDD